MLFRSQKFSKKTIGRTVGLNLAKGFTLIEFLVASSLGIIVLLAIGTTYSITNQMKRTSESRLSAQQDLRSAAEMIIRDARMAGSFGCFNMGNLEQKEFAGVNNAGQGIRLELNNDKFSGVSTFPLSSVRTAFNQNGFELLSDPLVFVYGVNPVPLSGTSTVPAGSEVAKWSQAGGQVALASCFRMEVNDVTASGGDVKVNNTLPKLDMNANDQIAFYIPQTTVSQVHANAYAIGRIADIDDVHSKGLYRFTLGANGGWEGPQLLVANIQNMQSTFTYAGCGENNTAATFDDSYSSLKNNPNLKRVSPMPTMLELSLQVSDNEQTHGHFNEFLIRANVRGGSVCAGL